LKEQRRVLTFQGKTYVFDSKNKLLNKEEHTVAQEEVTDEEAKSELIEIIEKVAFDIIEESLSEIKKKRLKGNEHKKSNENCHTDKCCKNGI
jgi:Ran GTPase-activating protein (RanGAP) involved in mRNA processing and transport